MRFAKRLIELEGAREGGDVTAHHAGRELAGAAGEMKYYRRLESWDEIMKARRSNAESDN